MFLIEVTGHLVVKDHHIYLSIYTSFGNDRDCFHRLGIELPVSLRDVISYYRRFALRKDAIKYSCINCYSE